MVDHVAGTQLCKAWKEHFFTQILPTFERCGYELKHSILNADAYAVPQNRKRVIIIGRRKDIKREINFPKPLNIEPKILFQAIGDLPKDYDENISNHTGSTHKIRINGYIGNRALSWDKPAPTIQVEEVEEEER